MLLVRPGRENGEIGGIAYRSISRRQVLRLPMAFAALLLTPFRERRFGCILQQFRQLGDVERDPAGFISGEQIGSGAPSGLFLEIYETPTIGVPLLRRRDEAPPHNPKTWSAAGKGHLPLPFLQMG